LELSTDDLPGLRMLWADVPAMLAYAENGFSAISSALGFDGRGYRDRLDQSPASLNVLDFKDPVRARLMLFNDVSHYMDHPKRSGGRLSKWWDEPRA